MIGEKWKEKSQARRKPERSLPGSKDRFFIAFKNILLYCEPFHWKINFWQDGESCVQFWRWKLWQYATVAQSTITWWDSCLCKSLVLAPLRWLLFRVNTKQAEFLVQEHMPPSKVLFMFVSFPEIHVEAVHVCPFFSHRVILGCGFSVDRNRRIFW